MTTPVSAIGAATATPATAQPKQDAMGKDAFLKLLVAQLKYQNPLSPTDGAEFMAQTAQFTVVEKLDELSKQNAELLSSNRALGASSLIGR
jgi:flagellar basal-body rod modification protein FlgD